ncbi:hypothetical protein CYMTET_34448 [Cymbomonas tetramitiformis]|uniref:PDZ domain-containing protein n=1 Tax=Cymbomonas tetramitiformis TaxID=36881 RepID=A0AAE0FB61_9CHLO|nr:hypothetical protein CYMTET_34448 [Cymbomonas tetramitiformis]
MNLTSISVLSVARTPRTKGGQQGKLKTTPLVRSHQAACSSRRNLRLCLTPDVRTIVRNQVSRKRPVDRRRTATCASSSDVRSVEVELARPLGMVLGELKAPLVVSGGKLAVVIEELAPGGNAEASKQITPGDIIKTVALSEGNVFDCRDKDLDAFLDFVGSEDTPTVQVCPGAFHTNAAWMGPYASRVNIV